MNHKEVLSSVWGKNKGYMMLPNSIGDYINGVKRCLDEISTGEVQAVVDAILGAYHSNNCVFVLGNGGSAATASHFALDLSKGTRVEGKNYLRAMSLTDNVPLMTALCNDISYTSVFKEQLVNFLSEGDVVICITASGNSPNVLEAARYAGSKRASTIGLIGFGGGRLKEITDVAITISSKSYRQVEDTHMVLAHLISQEVERGIRDS